MASLIFYYNIFLTKFNTQIFNRSIKMSTKLKTKPSLKIQINSDDNEQSPTVRYFIPVVKSAKNNHQLKKFNFTQVLPSQLSQKIEKQEKIKKLEKEKAQLMESLEILKNGAVNAIVEKQQIISKLRKLFSQTYPHQSQDTEDPKLQQLQNLLAIIKDLQQERNILRQEVQIQKQNFYMQIQQRDAIIQQLTNQLNWSTQRIDSLQKYDKLLEQKIKVMQQSNQNLSILFNQSQQNLKDQRRKHTEQSIIFKNKSNSSIHHGSDSENGSFWNVKPGRKRSNNYNFDELGISMSKSLDESILQSKMQQIKNQHQLQIQDLTDFYQTRIQTLKKLCEPYTDHPLTNITGKSKQLNETNVVTQVVDNSSNYSGFTNDVKEQQKILRKKLSLGSFKSGGGLKMDTIDQRQEIQSPRRSLRRQIQSFYKHNNNNSQAQISKNNANQSVDNQSDSSKSSNVQKQSQFSYKYFQYPTSNFKKNKTQQGQLSHLKQQTSSMRKIPQIPVFQINRIPVRKQSQAQTQQRKKIQSKQFWQKFIWFASGTITGGILLNFGNKLLK